MTADPRLTRRRQVAALRQQRYRDRQRASKGLPLRRGEAKLQSVERLIDFVTIDDGGSGRTILSGAQAQICDTHEPKSCAITQPAIRGRRQHQFRRRCSSASVISAVQDYSPVVGSSAMHQSCYDRYYSICRRTGCSIHANRVFRS